MTIEITQEKHEELVQELPAYSDMIDFIETLRKAANIPGSQMFNLDNIQSVIEQAAKFVTGDSTEQAEAEEQLNYILR